MFSVSYFDGLNFDLQNTKQAKPPFHNAKNLTAQTVVMNGSNADEASTLLTQIP